jgi:phosphoserine aminotransferase
MPPITFYPGPSKVYDSIPRYFEDAYRDGILSINHRSSAFADLMQELKSQLVRTLTIPDGYHILFASSATECWEIISQSIAANSTYHIYNGAFGERWLEYAKRIIPQSTGQSFPINESIDSNMVKGIKNEDVLCITQNETSNGSQVDRAALQKVRSAFPDKILAVDATSSMGGIYLDISLADIWYASVQKCFGIPAGLALMIVSEKAVTHAKQVAERNHYNSLLFSLENYDKNQAPYTPNVAGMYLLMRSLQDSKSPNAIYNRIQAQANNWYSFLEGLNQLTPLLSAGSHRSETVITVKGNPELIKALKTKSEKAGIIFGNGYGAWKENTFRIANFPAIVESEITLAQQFLTENYS